MPDWTSSMQQSFEYYIVDPYSWLDTRKLDTVLSCTITRDSDTDTLGSADIEIAEQIGEKYVRVYLVTIQNGIREKAPLGTFLVQTPSVSFDGKLQSITLEAYSPLLELREKYPPLGFSIFKGEDIMNAASALCRDNTRAPVMRITNSEPLITDFVADTMETWLEYLSDLIANARYSFSLDEMGRVLFAPDQDTASLQPIWTYTDDNSSILYPDINMDRDLYGIPNVVEVVESRGDIYHYARAINDDPNSPTSIQKRGREIVYRIDNPEIVGDPTTSQIEEYAKRTLREMSTLEYTVKYTHGYCPVRIGDCVEINYKRSGIPRVKAKVISQTIKCKPGCSVTEKATFTTRLWG